mgnify:CR=1 FL=1|jgi:hypothetical protein
MYCARVNEWLLFVIHSELPLLGRLSLSPSASLRCSTTFGDSTVFEMNNLLGAASWSRCLFIPRLIGTRVFLKMTSPVTTAASTHTRFDGFHPHPVL